MPRPKKKYKTFHISVPEEDTEIMEWLSKQYNQSASVRQLIREAVDITGMNDYFTGKAYNRKAGQSGRAAGTHSEYEQIAKAELQASRMQKETERTEQQRQVYQQDEYIQAELPTRRNTNSEQMFDSTVENKPSVSNTEHTQQEISTRQGKGISLDVNILSDITNGGTSKKQETKTTNTKTDVKKRINNIKNMLDE